MVQEVQRRLGRIDILVNNAGIIQVGPVQTMTVEDYERAPGVMYWGVVYPTLAVLPSMLDRRGGRIVNITSIGGRVSVPHVLPYSAAKFAAVGFSEGLRAELAGTGVSVTTIAPGLMRTGAYMNACSRAGKRASSPGSAWEPPAAGLDGRRAGGRADRAGGGRGESERTLSVPATVLARFHGLFPCLTADLLGLTARLILPPAEVQNSTAARGMQVAAEHPSALRERLAAWGGEAAERFHQYPGPAVRA